MDDSDYDSSDGEIYKLPKILQLLDSDKEIGTNCEVRIYERIRNSKGERVLLRAGTSRVRPQRNIQDDWSEQSAMVLIREVDEKDCLRTELEIQSPHMKAALKACIPKYANADIERKNISIYDEPRLLFHHRDELMEYYRSRSHALDRQAATHVKFLLDHMFNTLSTEIRHFQQHMESSSLPPSLDYPSLWMAFIPGDIIYVEKKCSHTSDDGVLFRFEEMTRCPCKKPWCTLDKWNMTGYTINYNGENFGHCKVSFEIDPFEGVKPLHDIEAMPLRYHPDNEAIRAKFIERGRRFVDLRGRHYQHYQGVADLLGDQRCSGIYGETDIFPLRATAVNGRIIIDGEKFSVIRSRHRPFLVHSQKTFRASLGEPLKMSDNELMICSDKVAGYALNEKKWGWFRVIAIRDVELDIDAFSSLILETSVKETLHSLVESHGEKNLIFDDVIKGKGKGLVFLLHGEPGTGKTLTAESIADHLRMPLLRIDAASLGSSMADMELNLAMLFELAERWHAIALLDEADIFLEQRELCDLERNRLVATFLRAMEYFGGILFLTTNRVDTFDRALRSRIHLAIYYPPLDVASRAEIWKACISRCDGRVETEVLEDSAIELLSHENLNGREIRNVVHMANALAATQERPIREQDFTQALSAMRTFNTHKGEVQDNGSGRADESSTQRSSKKRRIT